MSLVILITLTGCSSNSTETTEREPVEYATDTGVQREEISVQDQIIEEQKLAYDKGDYSLENPYVTVDPFEKNILSAYVVFPIENDSSYSFTVEGKDENTSFTASSEVQQSENMIVPVYGLYENYNNLITINVLEKDKVVDTVDVEIQTEAVGSDYDLYKTLETDYSMSSEEEAAAAFENGLYFTAKDNGYDVNGELRVALGKEDVSWENPVQFQADGSFLQLNEEQDALYDIDMNGYISAIYVEPDDKDIHHDAYVASNGYVYALTTYGVEYEESQAEEKYNMGSIAVYEAGTVSKPVYEKDLSPQFVGDLVNNAPTNSPLKTDLLHMNSITYDEPTDTILISSQSTNMIIGVDAHNLDVKWTTAEEANRNAMGEYALEAKEGYEASNGQHNIQVNTDPKYDDGKDYTIEYKIFDNIYCVDNDGNTVYTELDSVPAEKDCPAAPASELIVQRVNTRKGTIETLESQLIEDYRSHTQSSWFTSQSNDYNFITYTNSNLAVVTDADFNILVEYRLSDENKYNISYYRSRVISGDELTTISDHGLKKLIA